jgi:hypothetical protein
MLQWWVRRHRQMRVPACTAPREPEGGRKEGTSSSRRRDQKGKQSTRWASDPRNPWAERGISTINDAKEAPLSQNALGAVDCARQKERAQRHNGPLSLFHRQTIWLPANGTATRSSLPLSNPRRMHPGCGCVSLREHRAPQTVRRRCNAACDARGHCCCRHHDGHCHRAMRIHRVHHVHHGCCQSAVSYGNTRTPRQKIQKPSPRQPPSSAPSIPRVLLCSPDLSQIVERHVERRHDGSAEGGCRGKDTQTDARTEKQTNGRQTQGAKTKGPSPRSATQKGHFR